MKCLRARVKLIGRTAIVTAENGAKAMMGVHVLCQIAKRLNLCLENYECP